MLLVACANPLTTTRTLSVEEQCRVLHEKRVKTQKPNARLKNFASRKTKPEAVPAVPNQAAFQIESIQLSPFPVERLYASVAEPVLYSSVHHSEFITLPETPSRKEFVSYNDESSEISGELMRSSPLKDTTESIATGNSFLVDNSAPIMMGASGLFSLLMLSLAQKRSIGFSHWAARHPWAARGLIAGTHVVISLSALTLGHYLYDHQIFISDTVSYTAMSVIAASCLLYPSKNSAFSFTHSYFAQKATDIALFTSGAIMMLYAGNHYQLTQQPAANSEVVYSLTPTNDSEKSIHLVKNKKDLKKEKQEQKQEGKKERSTGAKIALTILALGVFTLGLYGVGIWACSLSCSGYEALAAFVLFGGLGGLITLLVVALRGIFSKKRKSKKTLEATEA